MPSHIVTQVCSGCGELKPVNRDHFGSTRTGGFQRRCRTCVAAQTRAYDLANPEKAAQRSQKRQKRLIAAGPGPSDLELAWLRVCQKDRCGYCDQPLNGSGHLDHITPLAKGGTNAIENLAFACFQCNAEKHAKTAAEYLVWRIKVDKPICGWVFEGRPSGLAV